MVVWIVNYLSGSYIHPETTIDSVWSTKELAEKRKKELEIKHNYISNPFQYSDILKVNKLLLNKGIHAHDDNYEDEAINTYAEILNISHDESKQKYEQYKKYKTNLYEDYFLCDIDEYEIDENITNNNCCVDDIDIRNIMS